MLTKLRRRFVLITMCLVGAVLIAVMAVNIWTSYQTQRTQIQQALDAALQRWDWNRDALGASINDTLGANGIFNDRQPGDQPPNNTLSDPGPLDRPNSSQGFIPVVVVGIPAAQSTVILFGDTSILDTATLEETATSLNTASANEGYLAAPALFYQRVTGANNTTFIAFASATPLINDTLALAGRSILIGAAALLAFFAVSLLLSRIALRPVAEAWDRQRRFVADASHELKTPLTVILANNNILLAHPQATVANQSQWIQSTMTEAQRMNTLVQDLLLLAATDEDADNPGLSSPAAAPPSLPVDLSALVNRTLLQFDAVFFERAITLEAAIAPNITIPGNPDQLERLLTILLDNASKYAGVTENDLTALPSLARNAEDPCPQSEQPIPDARASHENDNIGKVHVTLEPAPSRKHRALLHVTNTGTPIAPEVLPHLFERFYRGDVAHSNTIEGYGLGLSLAQNIVETHHGTITVTSTPKNGTTFSVTL
jgi:signal transduction histidine kinase